MKKESIDPIVAYEMGIYDVENADEETLGDAIRRSRQRKACDKALQLLGYREHSAFELKRKLLRSVEEEEAEFAVEKMREMGYIDDEAFARKLALELSSVKLYGTVKVQAELQSRGISREIINRTLEALPDQAELIVRFAEAHGIEVSEENRERTVRRLLARGYRYDDIRAFLSLD